MSVHSCAVCRFGGETVEKEKDGFIDVSASCEVLLRYPDLATMSEERFRLIAKECLTGGIYDIAESVGECRCVAGEIIFPLPPGMYRKGSERIG